MSVILAIRRLLPVLPGWSGDKRCRVLAGCYETENGSKVHVAEQIGEIVSWHYMEWDGQEPLAIKMFVRVNVSITTDEVRGVKP